MNSTASPADTMMMSSIVIWTLGCSHATIPEAAHNPLQTTKANPRV